MNDYYGDLETQAENACNRTAIENGHTYEEAQLCEDGAVGCPNCPFKGVLAPRATDAASLSSFETLGDNSRRVTQAVRRLSPKGNEHALSLRSR